MAKLSSKEQFIIKSKTVHSEVYDYTKTEYVKSNIKVTITCPIHGDFNQTPNHHLRGHGCPTCGNLTKGINKKQQSFISEANTIHDRKYSYDAVEYINNKLKVVINCPKHGDFMQAPKNHLNGQGCPACGSMKSRKSVDYYIERFVKLAEELHNHKYDYSIMKYKKSNIKINIVCKEHGVFSMTPNSHLSGQGCPTCASSGFNKNKPAILYYLKINNGEFYKIGITNRDIKERFSINELKIIEVIKTWDYDKGIDALQKEQEILKEHTKHRCKGLSILSSGNTELFNTDVLNLDR